MYCHAHQADLLHYKQEHVDQVDGGQTGGKAEEEGAEQDGLGGGESCEEIEETVQPTYYLQLRLCNNTVLLFYTCIHSPSLLSTSARGGGKGG